MTESKAPAIARAAAILRLLSRSSVPMGVQAIAREAELAPSTCLYLLRALATEKLVHFDPDTKLYTLDAGLLTLAQGWLQHDPFSTLVQPVLDRIANDFGVTALGVQFTGLEHLVVTAMAQGRQNFQLGARVGSRFPALISATGRCLAAFGGYSQESLVARFGTLRWDNPPTLEQWLDQIAETRKLGYAVDEGQYIAGVTIVSAPVAKAGRNPSHALAAVGIGDAFDQDGLRTLADALVAGARRLSAQLTDS